MASSLIKLSNGESIPITDVKIDDILTNGVKVLGLIKIDATDIRGVYNYTYNKKTISGFNINICLGERNIESTEIIDCREKHLYQLLTDTGYFTVNGITVRDYNYGIDKYIEWSKQFIYIMNKYKL